MAKIKTADIKEYLNNKYSKQNWKRLTKRKFNYDNVMVKLYEAEDEDYVKFDGKLNWRVYDGDQKIDSRVIVVDDGEKILYAENCCVLPASLFDVGVYECEESDSVGFFILLKNENLDLFPESVQIFGDNFREYDIAGLEAVFRDKDFFIEDIQENMFAVYRLNNSKKEDVIYSMTESNYLSEDDIEEVKDILVNLGMTYSEEISEDPDFIY